MIAGVKRYTAISTALLQFVRTRQRIRRADSTMATPIQFYQDLDVWQVTMELSLTTYRLVAHLPASERFELSAQTRRAAVSVPSNIAEGHGRRKTKPYLNHVNIALGSLAELETCVLLALRLGYLPEGVCQPALAQIARSRQMLYGLARSLERRLKARLTSRLAVFVGSLLGFVSALS